MGIMVRMLIPRTLPSLIAALDSALAFLDVVDRNTVPHCNEAHAGKARDTLLTVRTSMTEIRLSEFEQAELTLWMRELERRLNAIPVKP